MKLDPNKPLSIAIIGAGIAGLSCGEQLQSLGFKVTIFEKSRGASGRMSTRRTDSWAVDHGAQYFTARDPLFIQALNVWKAEGLVAKWEPTLAVFENGAWRVSHGQEIRYVGTPDMTTPAKWLAKSLSVQYSTTIKNIIFSKDCWTLESEEAGVIANKFDLVVLAMPSPQASKLLVDVDIEADAHALSSKAVMKPCWTMMAHFIENRNVSFDAAFINDEPIAWLARNNSKPGRDGIEYWCIHANPDWSEAHLELSKEEVSEKMMACLKGLGFNTDCASVTLHRWRYASGGLADPVGYFYSPSTRLGLCGDWLNGGRVEGAWLSGRQLALAISESLS